jgi:hypothetical protein
MGGEAAEQAEYQGTRNKEDSELVYFLKGERSLSLTFNADEICSAAVSDQTTIPSEARTGRRFLGGLRTL